LQLEVVVRHRHVREKAPEEVDIQEVSAFEPDAPCVTVVAGGVHVPVTARAVYGMGLCLSYADVAFHGFILLGGRTGAFIGVHRLAAIFGIKSLASFPSCPLSRITKIRISESKNILSTVSVGEKFFDVLHRHLPPVFLADLLKDL
jgi:hypothetical protein